MLLGIVLIVLGLILLAFGSRLALLGAGVGALLGLVILNFLPGDQDSLLWLVVPVGLAILFAVGTGLARGFISLITLALGAVAGAAIVLVVLDLLGFNFGLVDWLLALVGAVIGALLASRFKDWAIIILAAVVGALLAVRGLQMLVPSVEGTIASLIGLLLAGGAIAYHSGLLGGGKAASKG